METLFGWVEDPVIKEKKKIAKPAPNNNYLLIAVSGGRSSAMMARHIQTHPKYAHYEKLFVFCNTGQEKPQTIQFLKDMVKFWNLPLVMLEGVYSIEEGVGVRHKVINDFDSLNMTCEPLKGAIMQVNKYEWAGVYNQAIPYCSEYVKTRVSHSYAREIFGTASYTKAIGYRKEDQPKRITMVELRNDLTRISPLLTDFPVQIGLRELTQYFNTQPFKLGISSKLDNCELCNKASTPNLIERIKYGVRQETIDFHREMQTEYGNMFFREKLSIDDLIKMAEEDTQIRITDEHEPEEEGCICSF